MAIDKPYSTGIFETITDVHFGNLYLLVSISGSNQSYQYGLDGPAPLVIAPSISAAAGRGGKSGARLLDTVRPHDFNSSTNGFLGCFVYLAAADKHVSWVLEHGPTSFAATDNACPWPGGGPVPDGLAVAPVNFQRSATGATFYLFSIPAGEEVVTFRLQGFVNSDSGLDTSTYSQTIISGAGNILVRVYSRTRGKITKVSQLLDYTGDGRVRPTEDDGRTAAITPANQGTFLVNISQDKKLAHAQIDNYGKSFQPYKIALIPTVGTDQIPSQPPPRLGK